MVITTLVLIVFVGGGAKKAQVPGRWQMAVEGLTGFVDTLLQSNIGDAGRKYLPYVFSLFTFILFANLLGLLPLALVGIHPFTATSHFTVTGVLAIMSFAIVLIVGFAKHGFHFFSLFVPHGTPALMVPVIFPIELISFLVRPFSLGLRLFVAMMAGHVLLEVLGLRHLGHECGRRHLLPGRCAQLRADDRHLRSGTAGCRHPGLCVCPAYLRLSQRRGKPSLTVTTT
jgi:F-type H+-transporting ATPase subunit a